MTTKSFFSIEFKGGQGLINELAEVELRLNDISTAIKNAKKEGKTDLYKDLRLQQENLKKSSLDLKKALRESVKDFETVKAPIGSLQALRGEYSKLTKEIALMTETQRKGADGIAKINIARNIKTQIEQIDQSMGIYTSNIGNYKSALIGVGDVITGGLVSAGAVGLAVQGAQLIKEGVQAVFKLNKDVSDLQADVQKVTGLSTVEVDNLTESLIKLDSRNSIEELLKIATAGGRLGIEGAEGIEKFTKSIDLVSQALGDDLGGDSDQVIKDLGKLTNVLFGVTTNGEEMAQRLLGVGNALNVLSASGQSQADTIVDMANRISSLLGPIGATEGQILGLSAAMDEFAINPERGGTAMVRIIQTIGGNLDKFAEKLGFNQEELKKSFDTNPVETFQNIAERAFKLSGGSGSELIKILQGVGLKGVGVTEVFAKLGQNSERTSQLIDIATDSFTNYNSIVDEVSSKQNALAGVYERFINNIREQFIGSGFEAFFVSIINGMQDLFKYLQPVNDAIVKLFNSIFAGTQTGEILTKIIKGLVVGIEIFGITLAASINYISDFISWIKEAISKVPLLSGAINGLGKVVISILDLFLRLPEIITGVNASIRQLFLNLKNLNFDTGITEAYDIAVKKYREGNAKLRKEEDAQVKINKKKKAEIDQDLIDQVKGTVEAEDDLNKKRLENKKKSDTEYEKSLESQLKSIKDNQRKIKELTVNSIDNIFDKEIEKIKSANDSRLKELEDQTKFLNDKISKQGGRVTSGDNEQANTIKQETELIKKAIDNQTNEVNKKRLDAYQKSKDELKRLQTENLKSLAEATKFQFTEQLSDTKDSTQKQIKTIEIKYQNDKNSLDLSYAQGEISFREYSNKIRNLEESLQKDKTAINLDGSIKVAEITKNLYKVLVDIAKANKEIDFLNIDSKKEQEINTALKDFSQGKIETVEQLNDTLNEIEDRANTKRLEAIEKVEKAEKESAKEIENANIKADENIQKSDDETAKKAIENAKRKKETIQTILQEGIELGKQLSDSLFELEYQNADNQKTEKLRLLEEEYAKKAEYASGNATLEEALKKELEAKKYQIEKAAFEKNKKLQIAQTLINSALAATAIFAVPDFTFGIATAAKLAALAITTATSIATIKRQEFAGSGVVGIPRSKSGVIRNRGNTAQTSKGDNVLILAKENEMILNEGHQEAIADIAGNDIFHRIKVPGFAGGGYVGNKVPNFSGAGSSDNGIKGGVSMSQESIDLMTNTIAASVYEAVKEGSLIGSMSGTHKGIQDRIELEEKRTRLALNTEF